MSRVRQFIDTDVLTEARKRLDHVLETFDSLVVAWSGGKDSTVCLLLVRDVYERHGLLERGVKVRALFRDEEVIPDEVINYLLEREQAWSEWLDLTWWAVPLENSKSILGAVSTYAAFDPERSPWVRQPPAHARREVPGYPAGHVFNQYDADDALTQGLPGKVALITGIRADESLVRYRSVVNKLSENYITKTPASKRVMNVKPIFDWRENDVLRYFYDTGEPYCPLYDRQLWTGHPLRVATPITSEGSKKISHVARQTPDFYDRLLAAFPEVHAQEKVGNEVSGDAIMARFGHSYAGVAAWCREYLDPTQRRKALAELASIERRSAAAPSSYPPRYVLQTFKAGRYKRVVPPCSNPEAYQ